MQEPEIPFVPLAPAQEAVFEHAPAPIIALDAQLRIRFLNAAARALSPLPLEDLRGVHILARFPEYRDTPHLRSYQRVIETGRAQRFEEYMSVAGEWHALWAYPAEGGVIGILENVTDRRLSAQALSDSERALADAQRLSRIGSWTWHVVAEEFQWSAETFRILGLDPTAVAPSYALLRDELIHAGDRERWKNAVAAALNGRQELDLELRFNRPDGTHICTHVRAQVTRDANGAPLRLFGTVQDITERRRSESKLRRSEEALRLAQEAANIGSYERNLRTNISHWSDQLCRIVGLDPQTVDQSRIGRDPEFNFVHPEDRELVHTTFRRVIHEGGTHVLRSRIIRRDGVVRHLLTNTMLVRDDAGEPHRVIGAALDITEQVRAEDERLRLESQIQQAQKLESLGVLAGGIAHDFNNLLVGILGNASLALLDLRDDAGARRSVEEIEQAAQRAADLTRQLLAYAGKGRFVVEPVDLTQLVDEMATLLRTAISRNATLRLDLGIGLPSVEADTTQLRQVVMNLITNASDALGERAGTISIRCGTQTVDAEFLGSCVPGTGAVPGPYVYVEVRDSGSGMDAETQSRIFDPFFSTKFTGRGLGLAATMGIVKSHRGAIRVRSERYRGTTIQLFFPATDRLPRIPEPNPGDNWQGNGVVLVVDDEVSVRTVASRLLIKRGFEVVEAADGLAAVGIYRERAPDIRLVLLDLTMPGMGGEATFHALRELNPEARIVLMSGFNEQEVTRLFAGQGLAGFLQKPFRADDLFATIGRTLGAPGTNFNPPVA